MDAIVRVLVIVALIGFALFRIIRYFRYALAKRVTAIPPSVGPLMPNAPSARGANSGTVDGAHLPSRVVRYTSASCAMLAWLVLNILLGLVLFDLPSVGDIPLIWRLFVMIFANFYLLPLAQRLAERQRFWMTHNSEKPAMGSENQRGSLGDTSSDR